MLDYFFYFIFVVSLLSDGPLITFMFYGMGSPLLKMLLDACLLKNGQTSLQASRISFIALLLLVTYSFFASDFTIRAFVPLMMLALMPLKESATSFKSITFSNYLESFVGLAIGAFLFIIKFLHRVRLAALNVETFSVSLLLLAQKIDSNLSRQHARKRSKFSEITKYLSMIAIAFLMQILMVSNDFFSDMKFSIFFILFAFCNFNIK